MAEQLIGILGKWNFHVVSYSGKYEDTITVNDIQKARYDLITQSSKKTDISCTAINLDHANKREANPFDFLETTCHIIAVGNKKAGEQRDKIGCAVSCALESMETIHGERIGLPLENKANPFYPLGYDLDPFRETYKYDGKISFPNQRLELYRLFKTPGNVGDKTAGLGVFKSCNNEFITNRIRNQKPPVTKWLFCSKPAYYQYIYRPFGAMLIPLLLNECENVSPSLKEIDVIPPNDNRYKTGMFYNDIKFSYRFPIIIARKFGEKATERWFDYLPLVVDWDRSHSMIKSNPKLKKNPHLSQIAWRVICDYKYRLCHHDWYNRLASKIANIITRSNPGAGW